MVPTGRQIVQGTQAWNKSHHLIRSWHLIMAWTALSRTWIACPRPGPRHGRQPPPDYTTCKKLVHCHTRVPSMLPQERGNLPQLARPGRLTRRHRLAAVALSSSLFPSSRLCSPHASDSRSMKRKASIGPPPVYDWTFHALGMRAWMQRRPMHKQSPKQIEPLVRINLYNVCLASHPLPIRFSTCI